ncbi:MAG: OB-fold nucleic acid binding domain-containing protein, partial [Solirubrobacterales bacterium]
LTVQVAIVRPGPIQGGAVNPYIERRRRLREDPDFEVPYLHESLRPVLEETLGTIIFQDQVIEVAMAFAGFSAGEAEGLRRAMSRRRSQAAIEAHHRRFVAGATGLWPDVDEALAERVFTMIAGFSGFGFPKAHGAAFGLLAYQSTWLRVHYGPEFLASLVDEQPMGFYPPDALVHEAQRRGITVLPPDVNESGHGTEVTADGAVRIGLRQVGGVSSEELEELVQARRRGGRFRSLGDLAARAPGSRGSLEALAWAGACDGLAEGPPAHRRREVLWRLGARLPAAPGGQLSLGLGLPGAPELEPMSPWEIMIADYAATGMTTGTHPLAIVRGRLAEAGVLASGKLESVAHRSTVRVGGLVVARQRPATARGVCFMLLEDEEGTVNLVVPPPVYERFRLAVRTEPLVIAEGRLERHPQAGGTVNLLVERLEALGEGSTGPVAPAALDEARERLREAGEEALADFRAVAPAVLSFAQGRRR